MRTQRTAEISKRYADRIRVECQTGLPSIDEYCREQLVQDALLDLGCTEIVEALSETAVKPYNVGRNS